MSNDTSQHITWDDDLIEEDEADDSTEEEQDQWETSSHRSASSHRSGISVDLKNIQAALKEERGGWSRKAKLSFSILVTFAVLLSTVRVRSEGPRLATLDSTITKTESPEVSTNPLKSSELMEEKMSPEVKADLPYLANVADQPVKELDVPLLFHIPRSGGSTVKNILGECYQMTEATDIGKQKQRHRTLRTDSLEIVHSEDGASYVNVDTSTVSGIHQAKKLGLVESRLANIIVSKHLHPAAMLFNEDQRGRCFSMIRHPIERAVSVFHYLGVASWEPNYDPSLAYMSIEMYARSKRAEYNGMVRFLSNEMDGDLNQDHLDIAKKVLQEKCLIGLLDKKEESFHRFEKYFGWKPRDGEQADCRDRWLNWNWGNKHSHPLVEQGSVVWDLLYKKNELDMRLYDFALDLFSQQASLFPDSVE
mmetsp:Transcript_24294/g.36007  ORF Transcript_24294/g.36007 Transcript_24294/m.36007 type:complete len:421 (+) Transcript_24294:133-1395(+)|eukprot:CAMPEP_0194201996 /NCGR_PEP_ID=MMETSP0156-20130528/2129_1 /TAXON_ID=33649 /ORGANISM="Thalassionema nitzschioides, Strain L26-B" /LENGTH=420 /DNA_ID=CAMNT_0038927353 /DNA_START=75 /DNA_END=1337 /DNA_ORIENTATION=+